MKTKSVKSEKYRMWFNDLGGTQQMLEEHSADGWHLISFEMAEGKFTFKKGEPHCYGYLFVVNGESYNFKVFTDAFEKIYEEGGLSLYRCEEDVPEAYETVKKRFSSSEQERQWLSEMAEKGYFLYMVEKPAYTFTMGEGERMEYIIEKATSAKNAGAYLDALPARGLEYVWGAALGKMVYDVLRFGAGMAEYAQLTWVDLLAAAICAAIVIFSLIKRRKSDNP